LGTPQLASDLLECQLRFVEHSQATHILEKASTKRLLELVARLRTEKRLSLAMLSHAISLARGVLTN
jgi:hypothetical protein